MFDVGFWELILLFGLGLLILGPERLPRVAIQIGNWAGQARRMARTLTSQIRDELDVDLHKPFDVETNNPFGNDTSTRPDREFSRPGVDDLKAKAPADTSSSTDD